MPIYLFKNPKTEELIEVVQKMKDEHRYVDENGLEWDRVFVNPNASIDSKLDGSMESFMKYTENKNGTMGDLWDASEECSAKRKKQLGQDGVEQQHFKQYSKKRRGMKHHRDES